MANDITVSNTGAGTFTISGSVVNAGNDMTYTGTGTILLSGAHSGVGDVIKTGSNTMDVTSTYANTGALEIREGTVHVRGVNGRFNSSDNSIGPVSASVYCGATLILDSTDDEGNNRINNDTNIRLYGGNFQAIGADPSQADVSETFGDFTLAQDYSRVTITLNATTEAYRLRSDSGNMTSLRSEGSTLLVEGANLGENSFDRTVGTPNDNTAVFVMATAPTLFTASGATAASSRADLNRNTVAILPYAIGDDTTDSAVAAFLTYINDDTTSAPGDQNDLGLTLLTTYETDIRNASADENVSQNNDRSLNNNETMNSLRLTGSGTDITQSGSRTLTINSGGLLATAANQTITVTNLSFNNQEGHIFGWGSGTTLDINAVIQNSPGVSINDGTISFSGSSANTYTGETYVNQGTLRLNKTAGVDAIASGDVIVHCGGTLLLANNNQINDSVNMTLDGGTFDTDGFDDELGTLTLTATSTIDLGAGDSILRFANSSGELWNPDAQLFITNWSGQTGGGGTDQIYFGTDTTGLTAQQLSQIFFIDPLGFAPGIYNITQLSTGELAPFPNPKPTPPFPCFFSSSSGGNDDASSPA
ncbi:MAG: hypothetical protein HC904_10605 [Blastochloris sp.]|nr:hypothetical protein [Blastochloris sp.]